MFFNIFNRFTWKAFSFILWWFRSPVISRHSEQKLFSITFLVRLIKFCKQIVEFVKRCNIISRRWYNHFGIKVRRLFVYNDVFVINLHKGPCSPCDAYTNRSKEILEQQINPRTIDSVCTSLFQHVKLGGVCQSQCRYGSYIVQQIIKNTLSGNVLISTSKIMCKLWFIDIVIFLLKDFVYKWYSKLNVANINCCTLVLFFFMKLWFILTANCVLIAYR